MTQFTRIHDRFEYHIEDLNCSMCLFRKNKSERKNRHNNYGCGEDFCRFNDIRREALENGRLKRVRGWFSCRE